MYSDITYFIRVFPVYIHSVVKNKRKKNETRKCKQFVYFADLGTERERQLTTACAN